ncbi:MAG: hypothetical protein ABI120_09345 [Gemmatimonadaceae bacterium]
MPGPILHVGAMLTCTHAAPINTPTGNTRVFLNGAPALTIADVPAVAGCPFQIPVGGGTKPQPCITVKMIPSTKVMVNGQPVALLTPATLCLSAEQIPQGPPSAGAIQTRVIAL